MPVLTEETVKGTRAIEDCQILVAVFWAPGIGKLRIARFAPGRAHPVGHTVGRQVIVIRTYYPALARAGYVDQPAAPVGAETTEATLSFAYLALVDADAASDAVSILRRIRRQTELPSAKRVKFRDLIPDIREA